MTNETMTRRDREDLIRVARLRAKVAKAGVADQEARLLADVEQQLSAKYKLDDAVWADLTTAAQAAVADADQQVAGKAAKTAIEAKTAEVLTELIAGGLESDAARASLESIPTPAALMPRIDVDGLVGSKAIGAAPPDDGGWSL